MHSGTSDLPRSPEQSAPASSRSTAAKRVPPLRAASAATPQRRSREASRRVKPLPVPVSMVAGKQAGSAQERLPAMTLLHVARLEAMRCESQTAVLHRLERPSRVVSVPYPPWLPAWYPGHRAPGATERAAQLIRTKIAYQLSLCDALRCANLAHGAAEIDRHRLVEWWQTLKPTTRSCHSQCRRPPLANRVA